MPILLWIVKNWKIVVSLFAVLSALGGVWYYGVVKYREGHNKATVACDAQKQEVINENIQIRKKQDAVVRPDNAVLSRSMRDRSF